VAVADAASPVGNSQQGTANKEQGKGMAEDPFLVPCSSFRVRSAPLDTCGDMLNIQHSNAEISA
jgi:hypothetical protein